MTAVELSFPSLSGSQPAAETSGDLSGQCLSQKCQNIKMADIKCHVRGKGSCLAGFQLKTVNPLLVWMIY